MNNLNNKLKYIIIGIVGLLAIASIWMIFFSKTASNIVDKAMNAPLPKYVPNVDPNEVFTMSKEERIYKYLSEIFDLLNDKRYKEAYKLLKDDYKEYKFPTYESFEKYISVYMADSYQPKYKSFYYKDGLFIVLTELLKSNYTKEDLLNNISSAYFDTIVIEEFSENNYKFSFGGFVLSNKFESTSVESGPIIGSPICITKFTDYGEIKFSLKNTSGKEIDFSRLNFYVDTGINKIGVNGYAGLVLFPYETKEFTITYNLKHNSLQTEKYLVMYNLTLDNEEILLKIPVNIN